MNNVRVEMLVWLFGNSSDGYVKRWSMIYAGPYNAQRTAIPFAKVHTISFDNVCIVCVCVCVCAFETMHLTFFESV